MDAKKNISFQQDYWQEPKLKAQFIAFTDQIFGLDFNRWNELGFWDQNYKPLSFFEDGKIISTACLYTLPCIINGRTTTVSQLSAVATLPEKRNQGLSRALIQEALKTIGKKQSFTLLFSSESAIPFYNRLGFTPTKTYAAIKKASTLRPAPVPALEKISLDQLEVMKPIILQRSPVSNRFACLSTNLLFFHILYKYHDKLYYIPNKELILAAEKIKNRLVIYDIIAREIPSWTELEPLLSSFDAEEYEFRFYPDKLNTAIDDFEELKEMNLFLWEDQHQEACKVLPSNIQA